MNDKNGIIDCLANIINTYQKLTKVFSPQESLILNWYSIIVALCQTNLNIAFLNINPNTMEKPRFRWIFALQTLENIQGKFNWLHTIVINV